MGFFRSKRQSGHSQSTRRATTPSSSAPSSTTTTAATAATAGAAAPRFARFPEAIPCYNYYDIFPEDAGPMGHVVITDKDDLQVWKLVASPISPEEALKKGGCIQYLPEEEGTAAIPKYYEFPHEAEQVYGSASYQKSLPASPVMSDYVVTKPFPAPKHVDVNTSYSGLSDAGLTDTQVLVG